MKPYYWNLLSLGLTAASWLTTWLSYRLMPKSWDSIPFHLGFLVYLCAVAVLGWGVVRAVWLAIQDNLPWGKSLLIVGISLVQAMATLFFFLLLLAEGFHKEDQ